MSFSILGTGMYVPPRVVTNDDMSKIVDTNDEWIMQRVGVKERHVSTNETAADMGAKAALAALENSGVKKEEIDLILAASVSGESISPSVSCMIQNILGLDCMTMDINAACSAFVFTLETAAGFFARGKVKKVLVIGAERLSRIVDWEDRSTCVIFGDGAGAVVLGEGDNYLDSVFHVKGGDNVIDIPQLIGKSPFYEGEQKKPYIHMRGQDTFKFAVNAICHDTKYLLKQNGLTFEDIKYIVPHQANQRIIDFASVMLKVPKEKFYVNIDRYGNTSSASIPIALDEMNRKGMLQKGDLLLLPAFGGGFHSPFMDEASKEFAEALKAVDVKQPEMTVYSNYTTKPYTAEVRDLMEKQINHSLRWQESIENMAADGFDTFIEVGVGTTLKKLISRILPDSKVYAVSNMEEARQVAEEVR